MHMWLRTARSSSVPPSDAQLDAMFMALADPTRRAIIRRLTAGEATVTDWRGRSP